MLQCDCFFVFNNIVILLFLLSFFVILFILCWHVDAFCIRRSLDGDLGAVLKAAEEFDWNRIPFILEALLVRVLQRFCLCCSMDLHGAVMCVSFICLSIVYHSFVSKAP